MNKYKCIWSLLVLVFVSSIAMAQCFPAIGTRGADVSLTIQHDGYNRQFVLHIPASYDCVSAKALVVGVEGYGGTGFGFEHDTAQMFDHIEQHGYIGVFPDAMSRTPNSSVTSFNDLGSRNDSGPDGATCTSNAFAYKDFDNCGVSELSRMCHWGTSCADDVGFFRALIQHLQSKLLVDNKRVYMMGFSQGAQTVSTLACPLQDTLAAIAVVHGFAANGYSCGPSSKLSIMQISGTRDNTVRGDGLAGSDGMIYDSTTEAAAEWAVAQRCDSQSTPLSTSADGIKSWSCEQHANCANGSQVATCSWQGGHTWPRNKKYGNFGLQAIWDFLKTKSK